MAERAELHLPLPITPQHLHYRLNHTFPILSLENLSSMKPALGTKKVGDWCSSSSQILGCIMTYLEDLLKPRFLGPIPRGSDSVRLGWAQETAFLIR